MTSLSSHEHTRHECKQNITHKILQILFTRAYTHDKWKAALVNWRQKEVVREYSVSATNPTETEGIHACSTSMHDRETDWHTFKQPTYFVPYYYSRGAKIQCEL